MIFGNYWILFSAGLEILVNRCLEEALYLFNESLNCNFMFCYLYIDAEVGALNFKNLFEKSEFLLVVLLLYS